MRAVVIGAGPCGLAAAEELRRGGAQVTVLESESKPGGLAASKRVGAHEVDFGPHRLHREASEAVRSVLGELAVKDRLGRIELRGASVRFPLGLSAALDLGPRRALRYAADLAAARLARNGEREITFEDAVKAKLGTAVARDLYLPAAEKIWGLPASLLSSEHARARVRSEGKSLTKTARALRRSRTFLYPAQGTNGGMYEAWAKRLAARGVSFRFGQSAEAVLHTRGEVTGVRAVSVEVSAERVVSTLPLSRLMQILSPRVEEESPWVLRFRTVVLLHVVLKRRRFQDADVRYFPSSEVPFARITEQKAFGVSQAAPEDETVLTLDFYDDAGGSLTSASAEELFELSLPTLKKYGLVNNEVVRLDKTVKPNAYPVYERETAARRSAALDTIAGIDGLFTTGRGGLFLHVNQHHAIEMGTAAANAALTSSSRAWRRDARRFESMTVAD